MTARDWRWVIFAFLAAVAVIYAITLVGARGAA